MSETVFEGRVTNIESRFSRGVVWTLFKADNSNKPLAIQTDKLKVLKNLPKIGDKISIESNEGEAWFFAKHREMVVIRGKEPQWQHPEMNEDFKNKITWPILDWLSRHNAVSANDVFHSITELAPDRDPKIVGVAFNILAKQKVIHRVGWTKSNRPECHARLIGVWHLVSPVGA